MRDGVLNGIKQMPISLTRLREPELEFFCPISSLSSDSRLLLFGGFGMDYDQNATAHFEVRL